MQTQTPAENDVPRENRDTLRPEVDMEKLESMVTPEQVLSASVARRRRKFSKKRSTSASGTRESTPAREGMGAKTSTTETDDESRQPRPKTPERRRRRITKSVSKSELQHEEKDDKKSTENDLKVPEEYKPAKKHSFTDEMQTEIFALYDKAKRSVSRGRERFKKRDKEIVKRSQSTPNQITEQELIESFRKAQLLSKERERALRKYSTDSSLRSSPERIFKPPPKKTPSLRRRKPLPSKKIIEIIDPKSFNLVYSTKKQSTPISLIELFSVLRRHSPLELYRNYKIYKREMSSEYAKIRALRRKCLSELLIVMIYFGLGGVMFKFVEGAFENYYKCGVKRVKRDFIDTLWYKSHNLREDDWKSMARNKLRTFEEELHQAHEAGIHSYTGQRSWSFLNGVVYALTVTTTIGILCKMWVYYL